MGAEDVVHVAGVGIASSVLMAMIVEYNTRQQTRRICR